MYTSTHVHVLHMYMYYTCTCTTHAHVLHMYITTHACTCTTHARTCTTHVHNYTCMKATHVQDESHGRDQKKTKHAFVPRLDLTTSPLPPEQPCLFDNDTIIPITLGDGFALDQNIAYASCSFPTPKASLPH